MKKHTPAPWTVTTVEPGLAVYRLHDNNTDLTTSLYDTFLISAAPEMLEALETILKLEPRLLESSKLQIRNAIAKARGES